MALTTYAKVALVSAAVLAALASAADGQSDSHAFDQQLEALLAEHNATIDYAIGRRNPPNWTGTFVRRHNYPIETHEVRTQDGYLLTLHRIPGSQDGSHRGGPQVLLHHGFMSSSAEWVALGPKKALAFMLADRGFDVWLANARGTTDSRKHERLSPSSGDFWDFSWQEIGERDIPAEIDFILAKTKHTSLTYIGYSMGTTAFFVMGSERPEYMHKVKKMIALAPVAYMKFVRGPLLKLLAPLTSNVAGFVKMLGASGEFAPSTTFMKWAAKTFCKDRPASHLFCSNIFFMLFGFSEKYVDTNLLHLISEYAPAGVSIKTMGHFGQSVRYAPTFRKYDYGLVKNYLKYRQGNPPSFDLSRITCPTYLFVSANDWFATVKDTDTLLPRLANVQGARRVARSTFNHFDFIYAKDADALVYDEVVNIVTRG